MSVTQLEAAPDSARGVLSAASRPGSLARLRQLLDEALAALESLADNRTAFFFGLLALNALALPYGGVFCPGQAYRLQGPQASANRRGAEGLSFPSPLPDPSSLFSTPPPPLPPRHGVSATLFTPCM